MTADEIPFLLNALEAEPENWNTRRYLAEHYLRNNDESTALSLVTTAPAAPDTEDHALFATQLAGGHSLKRAHQIVDSFLLNNASSARAHLLKAHMYQLQGKDDKAATHQRVASVLDPHMGADGVNPLEVPPMQLDGYAEATAVPMPGLEKAALRTTGQVSVASLAPAAEAAPSVPGVAPIKPPTSPTETAAPAAEAAETVAEADDGADVSSTLEEIPAATPDVTPLAPPTAPADPLPNRTAEQIAMEGTGLVVTPLTAAHDPSSVVEAIDLEGDEEPEDLVSQIVERQTAMVAAMSGTTDEMTRKPEVTQVKNTNEKVSSIAIAVIAHVVILGLFTLVAMNLPENKPPEIYASVSSVDSSDDMQANELKKPQVAQQQPAPATQQVLSSNVLSEVAMPSVDTAVDSAIIGMGSDMGVDFGMSFSPPGGSSGMSAIPPSMAGRCSMGQRMARLKESGATTKCESAVRKALRFLKDNQNEDGSFGNEYPAAMTGLVILAMLGHCETPESVEFGQTVTKATMYLMGRAKDSDHRYKAIHSPKGKPGYENAICTYALAEMYTMTKASGSAARIPRLESTMKQGVKAIIEGQLDRGGWNYGYGGGTGDGSVTGWQFQALKAASNTGENISGLDKAMKKGIEWFKFAQSPQGGTSYRPASAKKEQRGLAGVGTLAFLMAGYEGEEFDKSIKNLEDNYIKGNPHGYAWYYIMQAFFLHGGDSWRKWNEFAMPKILETQAEDGRFKIPGGHGPKDPVAKAVYETALTTLMLEVYYRYLPTTQKNLG